MRPLLLAVVLLAGCQSAGDTPGPLSHEAALRSRIDELYRAEQKKDWRARYELTAQAKHKMATYEEMIEAMSGEEQKTTLVSWRIISIRPQAVHKEVANLADEAARVSMHVVIRHPGGKEEVVPDFTDYWFLTDGQWYWGWRGFPTD